MLTVFAIEKARPRAKPYKLSDGNGLHLLVEPNGSKLWRFRYHFDRKEKMMSLGSFPEISLASARTKRDEARKLVAAGTDPSQQRLLDKIAAAAAAKNSFGAIVEDYLEELAEKGVAESTMSKNRWLLQELAAPLSKRPITEIKPAEILPILKRVEKSGRRETARRLRGAIGTVFRYAIANLKAENDPTFALRGSLLAPKVQHRPAITDERQLGALMVSIDEYDGWPTVRAALQLIALTMTRPGRGSPHAPLGNQLAKGYMADSGRAHEDETASLTCHSQNRPLACFETSGTCPTVTGLAQPSGPVHREASLRKRHEFRA